MNSKVLLLLLVASIFVSAIIGAGSAYYFNEILQLSHKTTYSLEEEIVLYDQMIEKAKKNEIENSDLIRIFLSEKKRRIAAHDVMSSNQELSNRVIATLILVVIGQIILASLYIKNKSEN